MFRIGGERVKYRICKSFEVESGHLLSKHPERCKFPHGHTRRVEIVLEAEALDANDMVVDFKALKLAVADFIDRYDHALCVNADDPLYPHLLARYGDGARIIPYRGEDPTSEVMAREIFCFAAEKLKGGTVLRSESGTEYHLPDTLRVARVRIWETTSSWAEIEA
jgi:6-pyruvoyltetrahydropterin/6-carboxytetrahydropterin synthase